MSALRLHRRCAALACRSLSAAAPSAAPCARACHGAAAASPPYVQSQHAHHAGASAHPTWREPATTAASSAAQSPRDSGTSGAVTATVDAIFAKRFGKQAAASQQSSGPAGVDALFASRFRSPVSAAVRGSAPGDTRSGVSTSRTGAGARVAPWSGLWRLTALQNAPVGMAAVGLITPVPLHVPAPAPPRGQQGTASAPHPSSSSHTPAADPVSTSSYYHPSHHSATAATSAAPASAAPPSPALQRYWRSYQLWQSLMPRIYNEQQALAQLRAQAQAAKAAHRADLQRHLHKTTSWTLFLVCPLLGLLFASLVMDAAVYQAEVAQVPFVAYEDALRDFNAVNGKEAQQRRTTRGGESKKTRNIDRKSVV